MSTDHLMRERSPKGIPEHDQSKPEAEALEAGTPDAIKQKSARRDALQERLNRVRGRGVDWVRPTDLFVRSSGNLAGRGIEFQAVQGRRFRSTLAMGARSVSERAKRLPPVSAFGRRGQHVEGPARSGVGMR
ncbi:hypothetical protein [Microbacterium dextranolyticum]|uniref:Uncharacterized protein n=1 Tax=Microbacterium dextranolyticum TaxID=36806 RepID=A0A9W6HNR9_9MICO|nr:hypothetical protein [Microbacterium dextranolyticum]MBM7462540.1 hypothetical protein [Microbacterium dextranolyticum]GLJ96398.1 hypothetical protein GCM10017591_24610 [Microbacterium dextranolyticum]